MVGDAIAKEKAMMKATAHTRAAVAFLFETRCWVVLGMVLDVLGCLHVYIHKICLVNVVPDIRCIFFPNLVQKYSMIDSQW